MQIKKIRIGYLMHGIGYGGAVNSLLLLLNNLDRNFFEIYVYTIKSSIKELEIEYRKIVDYFCIISLPTISFNQVYQDEIKSFKKNKNIDLNFFKDRLLNDKIDILHINSTLFSNVIDFLKSNFNIPIVCHLRELIPNLAKDHEIRIYIINQILSADKLIAISENEAQYFKDHKNIEIIPNPIDFKIIDQIKLKNEICIQPEYGKVFVGMTGSFYGLKGHINFLKALEYLVNFQSFKEVKFFIVGSKFTPLFRKIIKRLLNLKDYGKELEDFISKHKLKHYITFLPYTRNVLKYLNNMDIVVRPADTADPWGRDIIEAMALGKPVVATGSSEFYIENGKNGYLVPPNDPEALANKIISLVSSKSLRIEFGNKSYKKVKFMCNVNEHTKKIENAYKALLNN